MRIIQSLNNCDRVYLAAPYTDIDPNVRQGRYQAVTALAGQLMASGCKVFSPITHRHPLAASCPDDPLFWKSWYLTFLERWASLLFVCMLPGWDKSRGVACEIAWAEEHDLPIFYYPRSLLEKAAGRKV